MLNQEEHTQSVFSYEIGDDETVTQAIVEAVSTVSGTPPVPAYGSDDALDPSADDALDPLYTAINPEALDSLFCSDDPPEDARLEFRYHGYEIAVHAEGRLSVSEA